MAKIYPFSKALDALLPPRCLSCDKIVQEAHSLCADCWLQAHFITRPFCKICGLPFDFEAPDQAMCLDCARHRPPFVAARSVFPYDDFSKKLIIALKHHDRSDFVPALAKWMIRSAPDLIEQSEMIVPVPLHWQRLLKRRFNQSALLAKEIAHQTNLEFNPQSLKRIRHTPPQGHLSRMARQKNLHNAFQADQGVEGKRILLIDDVLTTGATALNCTQTLKKAGALEVRLLTVARVL